MTPLDETSLKDSSDEHQEHQSSESAERECSCAKRQHLFEFAGRVQDVRVKVGKATTPSFSQVGFQREPCLWRSLRGGKKVGRPLLHMAAGVVS